MTPQLLDKHAVLARLGSFWHQGMEVGEPAERIRALAGCCQYTRAHSLLEEAQARAAGEAQAEEAHVTLHFNPADVVQLGADLQQRLTTRFGDGTQTYTLVRRPPGYTLSPESNSNLLSEHGLILSAESDEFLLFPSAIPEVDAAFTVEALQLRYLVPIEHGLLVVAAALLERDLVAGLDFIAGDGYLIFNEPPSLLFPDGRILARAGRRPLRSLFNYPLQVDANSSCRRIARYLRGSQSARAFQAAIAEAAGLVLLPWASTLLEILPGSRYVFAEGVVEVPYAHTAPSVGQNYPEDFVFGELVEVHTDNGGDWWRRLDWGAGLSLDGLCPFQGLRVPDRPGRAVTSAFSSDYHVRLPLEGPGEMVEAFWGRVQAAEVLTGRYLNAVVGLTSMGDSRILNPLDFYFTHLLQRRGVVVKLRTAAVGADAHRKALDFIRREKPVGSIVIVL